MIASFLSKTLNRPTYLVDGRLMVTDMTHNSKPCVPYDKVGQTFK